MKRFQSHFILFVISGVFLIGCSSRVNQAEQLFEEGKYREAETLLYRFRNSGNWKGKPGERANLLMEKIQVKVKAEEEEKKKEMFGKNLDLANQYLENKEWEKAFDTYLNLMPQFNGKGYFYRSSGDEGFYDKAKASLENIFLLNAKLPVDEKYNNSVFISYGNEVPKRTFDFFISRIDFPNYYKNRTFREAMPVWVSTREGEFEAICSSPTLHSFHGISIEVKCSTPIVGGPVVLSLKRFPKKTWRLETLSENDAILVGKLKNQLLGGWKIVCENAGIFLLFNDGIPLKEEPLGESGDFLPVVVRIYQESGSTWESFSTFDSPDPVRPIVDIDGDGVPEIFNYSPYEDIELRTFFPQAGIVARKSSGI